MTAQDLAEQHVARFCADLPAIRFTRREFFRHGVTTVDLTDADLIAVVNLAYTLLHASGAGLEDWGAWAKAMERARQTLECK